MMTRTTTLALFICAVLLAAYIFLIDGDTRPNTARHTAASGLIDIEAAAIDELTIQTTNYTATAQRTESGWRLTSPVEANAYDEQVESFLSGLESYTRDEVITPKEQADRLLTLEQFELSPEHARVRIKSMNRQAEILIGAEVPLTDKLYAKFSDKPEIIATSQELRQSIPADVDDIRDRALFSGNADDMTYLSLRRAAGGSYILSKRKGQWYIDQPFRARAHNERVTTLIDRILTHRVTEFIWDPPREEAPEADRVSPWQEDKDAVSHITLGSGETRATLLLGQKTPNNQILARMDESKSVFTVSPILMQLFQLKINSLRDTRVFASEAEDLAAIRISEGDHRLTLRNVDDGWRVEEPIKHRASSEIVDKFLK